MTEQTIKNYQDLEVYKMAFDAAMKVFELSKNFPLSERFTLNDSEITMLTTNILLSQQIRCSSRSICTNIASSWYKRMDEAVFISQLNDCISWIAPSSDIIKIRLQI